MRCWFKRHPEHLRRESKELSSNSNYRESFQLRDNFFISCGEIVVRLDEVNRYPILICYPNSTPYSLPIVFLLERLYNEDEIKEIGSKKHEFEVYNYVKDNIKFYSRRHQNPDGSLCLLEADNLDISGAEFFTAHNIINRIRDWFAGLTTNRFPPDSPEVELFAHFSKQNKEIEFLFPETFYTNEIIQGEFYAIIIASVPTGIENNRKRIFLGALISGKNSAGLYTNPVEFRNSLHLLPRGIESPIDLLTKEKTLKSAIEQQELIKGYWWDISNEPIPFDSIDGFASFLGDGNLEKGYKRLHENISNEIKMLNNEIIIALRFPNRRSDLEWQTFKLSKTKFENLPIIGEFSIDNFKELIQNYEIEAVYSEPVTEFSFHKRNSTRARRDALKHKRINIIGCGALGGEIADCLGKAGIGKLNLIDKENFRAHNAIRHIIGTHFMSIPKVIAVEQFLVSHNPFVETEVKTTNVLHENINQYLIEDSISISTIADDNIEGYLNEQAIIYNKTVFYARALRGGKAARIIRVIPGEDACMNCLRLYHQRGDPQFIDVPEDMEFPTITNECNNPIRPASAADLKIISAITSRLIIDFLQDGDTSKNHWIWSMEKIKSLEYNETTPFVLHSRFLSPHSECDYCKNEDPIQIIMDSEVYEFMRSEIKKEPDIETGGILVGYKMKNGDIYIAFASNAGPKARKTKTDFLKDVEYCQAFVEEKYRDSGGKFSYVGEWHSHPSRNNHPSNTDLLSLSQIAMQKEYLTEKPVMLILSNEGKVSCTVHPANQKYYFTEIRIESRAGG